MMYKITENIVFPNYIAVVRLVPLKLNDILPYNRIIIESKLWSKIIPSGEEFS